MAAKKKETPALKPLPLGAPWDSVWGEGIVLQSTTMLGGPPGAGKTTMALQVAAHIAMRRRKRALFLTCEQRLGEMAVMLARLGISLLHVNVVDVAFRPTTPLEDWIKRTPAAPAVIVLDSISTRCGRSSAKLMQTFRSLKQLGSELHAPVILISHMTKESDFPGPSELHYEANVLATIYGDENGGREVTVWKNHFGPAVARVRCTMTAAGLIPFKRAKGIPSR